MVRSRLPVTRSPSIVNLRVKLMKLARRHEEMKTSFGDLKLQIQTGLIEAEDVFQSLSIPLMKLVGLKTTEMAEEGRFSTVMIFPQNASGSETPSSSPVVTSSRDQFNRLEVQERCSYNKATCAGKVLIEKQRLEFQQLVHLLRGIEACVNSSQENILKRLGNHQGHLQQIFQQAIKHLSSFQQTKPTNEAFLVVTHKLLLTIFRHVGSALASVSNGVEDLMTELAQHMCNPMTGYVKSLKAELMTGSLIHLVAVVEEMEGVMRDGQMELEEARRKMKVEEKRKLEALRRLKDADEKRRAMKDFVGVLLEAKQKSKEPFTPQQVHKGNFCQICEGIGHFVDKPCPFLYNRCKIPGCMDIRHEMEAHTEANNERKFLKCQHVSRTGFQWLDGAIIEARGLVGS